MFWQRNTLVIRTAAKMTQREEGFTLLEVAVSAMIMGVGLLAIMQLFALSALYNKSSKQTTLASSIAKRQLEQLLALPNPPASEPAPLGFGGATGVANAVTGYTKNYYVDYDRNNVKGTMQIKDTEWYPNQPVSYIATWRVQSDNVLVNGNPSYQGLRRITVQVDATNAALVGNGAGSTSTGANQQKPEAERAILSTIRSPAQ